jgi:hypothetical protein
MMIVDVRFGKLLGITRPFYTFPESTTILNLSVIYPTDPISPGKQSSMTCFVARVFRLDHLPD